jgi:Phage integrase, N-terminal SAM-like domain
MSEKPISPLRRRMIEDMTVRNFVEKTHNDYIRHVRTFTIFLGRAPDTAAPEDLRLFQLHQTQTGVRLSDAGHGASRIAAIGRHPKPSTNSDIARRIRHVSKVPIGDMLAMKLRSNHREIPINRRELLQTG